MDDQTARRLFASSSVARLATVRPDGRPHLVPVVFALVGSDLIYTAVDAKPKRTTQLQRFANLVHEPRCSMLVDHYDDDWSALWWVRADGAATVFDPADAAVGMAALVSHHPQYRRTPPPGPVIEVRVAQWSGWSGG